MNRYVHQVYGTSRVIVLDEHGEPVELPRNHPVHVEWNRRATQALVRSMQEARDE